MRGVLERVRGRLRLRFLIPLLVAFGYGVWFVVGLALGAPLDGGDDEASPPQTVAQRAIAHEFIDQLPTLPGAQRDPTSTACDSRSSYCIWDLHRTSEQLLADLSELMTERGASVRRVLCQPPDTFASFGCIAQVTFHGSKFGLIASPASGVHLARLEPTVVVPGHVALLVFDEDTQPSTGVVDDLASLVPAEWMADITCTSGDPMHCRNYRGTPDVQLSASDALALAVGPLQKAGFLIKAAGCYQADTGQRCQLEARRIRGANDISALGIISAQPDGRTRIILSLSAL